MSDYDDDYGFGDADLPEVDARLADWVDGQMSERDRERFEAEMRVSPQLREQVAEYERTVTSLRSALQAPTQATDLADRVMATLAADAVRPQASRRGALPLLWAVTTAAALLGVALWVDSWGPPPQTTTTADAVVSESAKVPAESDESAWPEPTATADELVDDKTGRDKSGGEPASKDGAGAQAGGAAHGAGEAGLPSTRPEFRLEAANLEQQATGAAVQPKRDPQRSFKSPQPDDAGAAVRQPGGSSESKEVVAAPDQKVVGDGKPSAAGGIAERGRARAKKPPPPPGAVAVKSEIDDSRRGGSKLKTRDRSPDEPASDPSAADGLGKQKNAAQPSAGLPVPAGPGAARPDLGRSGPPVPTGGAGEAQPAGPASPGPGTRATASPGAPIGRADPAGGAGGADPKRALQEQKQAKKAMTVPVEQRRSTAEGVAEGVASGEVAETESTERPAAEKSVGGRKQGRRRASRLDFVGRVAQAGESGEPLALLVLEGSVELRESRDNNADERVVRPGRERARGGEVAAGQQERAAAAALELRSFFAEQLQAESSSRLPTRRTIAALQFAALGVTAANRVADADQAQRLGAAAPAPRDWLVEGAKADMDRLLRELRSYADGAARSWRAGEVVFVAAPSPPPRPKPQPSPNEAVPSPAAKLGQEAAQADRRRVILRFQRSK